MLCQIITSADGRKFLTMPVSATPVPPGIKLVATVVGVEPAGTVEIVQSIHNV